jgi:HD-GYP domain-containing protein (c-di-GMP phosphodiesterase class II)
MFRRVLFHGADPAAASLARELEAEPRPFRADAWRLAADEVAVVLAGPDLAAALAAPPAHGPGESADRIGLLRLDGAPAATRGAAGIAEVDGFWTARPGVSLPHGVGRPHVSRAAGSLFRLLEERARAARDRRDLLVRTQEAQALVEIGVALAAETDPARLLETILTRARLLTSADAGSLFLVEAAAGGDGLRFALAQNDTVPLEFRETVIPLASPSIAGHVARSGESVRLDDAYAIPEGAAYRFDPDFDARHRYRTRSVVAVPMRTPAGRIVGVLQLLNRKRRVIPEGGTTAFIRSEVVAFEPRHEEIARSLAAQAAVAVENRRLTESIRTLFEGFVEASVTAIEQRDPTTSGHSHRVARLTCALAEAADRTDTGRYADFRIGRDELRELRYAAVLHDFGKVGVREDVLVKASKLSPAAFAAVRGRFEQALLSAAAEAWRSAAREGVSEERVLAEIERRRAELDAAWAGVEQANRPSVLAELPRAAEALALAAGLEFRDSRGASTPLLTPDEVVCLSIPRGSLTPAERREIESHVTQTHRFLAKIPWTPELARVPEWAYAHHEKLDGSGYPRRLAAAAIPVPVRMMTICDVYDALAARDRPYKNAVPHSEAISILGGEAARGAIDAELLRIFVEANVYDEREAGDGRR